MRKALPYRYLIPLALVLGLAPFGARPHLIEKLSMLLDGTLSKPVDVFDLLLHGGPLMLLLVRCATDVVGRIRRTESGTDGRTRGG